jgi:electron transfer flavoprotein-quinone oxidoreductase
MGSVTSGMVGTAFLYTNKESVSVGIGCLVSDFQETGQTPYGLLERFKNHPAIRPLLAESEVKEYAAHLIPEGGYKAMPQLCGDGWVIVGDAGQFVNSVHREGSNLAMTTGRIAGETIGRLKRRGEDLSAENLAEYRRRLEETFVMKDLKKYRNIPSFLHRSRHVFDVYPSLFSKAAQTWLRVDGVDKVSKEKEILGAFRKSRKWTGLLGDALNLARAWR